MKILKYRDMENIVVAIMLGLIHISDCRWTEWDPWTPCSVTCGDGVQTRERTCTDGQVKSCIGPSIMYNVCNLEECGPQTDVWSVWGEWSDCSQTCGGGLHVRRRTCLIGDVSQCCVHTDPEGCEYEHYQTRECANEDCHGHWSDWRAWSQCSESCGEGNQTRTRHCEPDGTVCSGPKLQTRSCYTQCSPESSGLDDVSCSNTNPCQNGGMCAHGNNHVTCFCHGDWRGNDCSSMCIRPDEDNVCINKEGIFHMCNNCTKFVICSRGLPISMACVDGRIWTGDGCKLPSETTSLCIEW